VLALTGLLTLLLVGAGHPGRAPAHAAPGVRCEADPPGGHDPKAEIHFAAVRRRDGRTQSGKVFEWGTVQDLLIEVRWEKVRVSVRQRLELYGPDGNLYQMFTTTLPAEPNPVLYRLPVATSWITSGSLAGPWCAKVFLDNDLEPVAADGFELHRR
jgi:hypothetical protein